MASSVPLTWEEVQYRIDRSGDCHIWLGPTTGGYGQIGKRRAHRIAYEKTHGKIPTGLFVCHTCDNRKCVNPEHLFLGTCQDNLQDMYRKGRHPSTIYPELQRGKNNGNSRLSEEQVLEIRRRSLTGEDGVSLGKAFGITREHAWAVATRKAWKHL